MTLELIAPSAQCTEESSSCFESSMPDSPPSPASTSVARVVDKSAIESAVRTILKAVGENPRRDGLLDTPARVARMYEEMFSGLHLDPARHLETTFPEAYDEIVLVRDIPFTSM